MLDLSTLAKLSTALRNTLIASAAVCAYEPVSLLPGERLPFLGYKIRDRFGPVGSSVTQRFGADIHESVIRLQELGAFTGSVQGPIALRPGLFDAISQALPFDRSLASITIDELTQTAHRLGVQLTAVTDEGATLSSVTRGKLATLNRKQREHLYLDQVQVVEHMALRTLSDVMDSPLASVQDKISAARAASAVGAAARKSLLDARKVHLLERAAVANNPAALEDGLSNLSVAELEQLQGKLSSARADLLREGSIDGEVAESRSTSDPFS